RQHKCWRLGRAGAVNWRTIREPRHSVFVPPARNGGPLAQEHAHALDTMNGITRESSRHRRWRSLGLRKEELGIDGEIQERRGSARWQLKTSGLFLCMMLALGLAACSSSNTSSGNINFSLGLAGSTADHQTQPPTIAANGPQGTYAFVYDDQIWVRQS